MHTYITYMPLSCCHTYKVRGVVLQTVAIGNLEAWHTALQSLADLQTLELGGGDFDVASVALDSMTITIRGIGSTTRILATAAAAVSISNNAKLVLENVQLVSIPGANAFDGVRD